MILWDRGSYHTVEGTSPGRRARRGQARPLAAGPQAARALRAGAHEGRGREELALARQGEGRGPLARAGGRRARVGRLGTHHRGAARAGDSQRARSPSSRARRGAPKRELPQGALEPMLAESTERAFNREGWLFEIKYDGARVVAVKRADGSAHLVARSGRDVTEVYPEITRAVRHLPVSECAIDGEVVALDPSGRALVRAAACTASAASPRRAPSVDYPVVFYAFDALAAEGHDLRGLPLDDAQGDPRALRAAAGLRALRRPRGGRGRGAARGGARAPARGHRRQARGLEVRERPAHEELAQAEAAAHERRWRSSAICRGKGSRGTIGSVLLGWRAQGKLVFAGAAGSGMNDATLDRAARAARREPGAEARSSRPPTRRRAPCG